MMLKGTIKWNYTCAICGKQTSTTDRDRITLGICSDCHPF